LVVDHPLSTKLFAQIASRRTLYVAVLLHDIAKGRGGDHSVLGAEVAMKLCPRFGLDAGETETVAWLVRHHLLMSNTAFRRDLADPQTIEDFVRVVQSPEWLRLLLILTIVDIRAVGPGTWTEWKRSLIRSIFEAAEERLRLGHKEQGRSEQVAARHAELARATGWSPPIANDHAARLPDSYWIAEPPAWQLANARQIETADPATAPSVVAEDDPTSGGTRVSVFAADSPGLFYRIAAGLAAAGASIFDARIHTTHDGMALDNLLVHDRQGRAYADKRLRARLVAAVTAAIGGIVPALPDGAIGGSSTPFLIAPRVLIAEGASSRTTVVEVNARDRPALLARLAGAIHDAELVIHSAHIATYGERAVDVFYLTDPAGKKLDSAQSEVLRVRLFEVAGQFAQPAAQAAE
ncbi:MAG: HD domain-containing protein, partial [Sphingomicrobium sp.]